MALEEVEALSSEVVDREVLLEEVNNNEAAINVQVKVEVANRINTTTTEEAEAVEVEDLDGEITTSHSAIVMPPSIFDPTGR